MTATHLEEVLAIHAGRLTADGLPEPDLEEARSTLRSWDEWYGFWAGKAERYGSLGQEALQSGRRRSAGELFWYGCMAYHYAQFLWFHDRAAREEGQRQKVRLYDLAAPLLHPPATRFSVPVDGVDVPGFLRMPDTGHDKAVGCVVLIGGLESTKEEGYRFENLCLERGLATCAFDGPGQGELFFSANLRPDFERFTSAVVDLLVDRPDIDSGRIGVLGRSLGGYYAVRSAAADPRLQACVAWGAMFDLSGYDRIHTSAQEGFAYVAGFDDPRAASSYLKESIDLSDVIGDFRAPLYVLHGAQDDLMPMAHVERLRQELHDDVAVEWDIPGDGNHCCHNLAHIVRPRMADWLAERLGGQL